MSNTGTSQLNIHLDDLPETDGQDPGLQRFMLMLSCKDKLGLEYGISSCLNQHNANVEASYGRRLDDIYGTQYVFVAPPEEMREITEDAIRESCLRHYEGTDWGPDTQKQEYDLTLIAPDQQGILATVAETLLKRKISIVSNDTVTFRTMPPKQWEGSPQFIKIATLSMHLEIRGGGQKETLEDLVDGLEYLEHRYHWYIQLEKHIRRSFQAPPPLLPTKLRGFGRHQLN